ncbi:methyltransferase domain-containing protein [Sulfuricurvum sp. RIFCSPLOWO2_12_FULL_43_24]|uniref:methyltransferase domain-containing protein n=1 Tax=Sulfuricurvum sp. RIFCSPLOWO2_12_FULL_43_24 TaxID=1802247 RepID=UPI0008CD35CB|nr:methyltransferase domain-containing protein [Sulfuricurvum sp. RIFCSPLOWO2_12_FULL_43_24]OHD84875.1 MAG: methyltransferase [Sulfuricurvum sp. RIFCSPHIGHO2_02_FULL_43_9]OHD86099.1 MAG: methyltransferase [Sulfuricurvum sp. RIFCSPLOWO2_02_FULL_43_45]OHD86931.1 MAG: methyltransferase [Sulfuricurvum sp. RIFCSPLOWO2_02_43_6]OHD92044.1 MAG: methyltransferase [Sulfuricurvum sp. RIFCSPLOWO2_12_43_5]OHD89570.1 MAG: methyltransferase [Sulfuricurvum sp. RIFCSPLOWO2_12_FULL_43_24]
MSSACHEFSRYAAEYGSRNVIQRLVAKKLIASTPNQPKQIVDLGCGNGTLYSLIDWEVEHFVGIDFSAQMLEHHPLSPNVELILGDFNDPALFETLSAECFEHIYSASALQWADDLESVLKSLASLNTPISLAIFTSGTFKTLHECAGVTPLLRSSDEVIAMAEKYMDARFEVLHTTLEFDSVREMFRYIKRSGVSGGRRVLNYAQTKQLMEFYPLNYLEFEVLFILKS